mmetsp:Transcript_24178/g.48369  ORF Transcript_24178/g.48369 Transcript_24178/m.48369 type:complete len:551 (-) Transcript_24178:387-2039(-)
MSPPSESGMYGAAFGTLAVFLVVTVALGWKGIRKFDTDEYLSARNTQGYISLTMSFFASGAGAWVLFTVPEAAILGGPIAVLGYAISCVVPLLIFSSIAPTMRRNLPYGTTFFEYVQARYGTLVNGYTVLISMFYMFLYLAAEFTSVGDCATLLSTGSADRNLAPIIGVSLVTLLYTSIGGLPVSLITDKIQGAGVVIFTALVMLAVAAYGLFPEYHDIGDGSGMGGNLSAAQQSATAAANWKMSISWGITGTAGNSFRMAVVLIIAVTSANLMHGGFQQRIWAAQDDEAVRNGLWAASVLTIPFMLVFGFFGMVAFAQFGFGGLVAPTYLAFLSAFFLIGLAPTGWQVLAIILAVMMVASSADTIQTGLAALFDPIIKELLLLLGITEKSSSSYSFIKMAINLLWTIIINVVAIVLATRGYSVLSLFVLADLLCATCIVPLLMGLSEKIHPVAALVGCLTGLATALLVYGVGLPDDVGNFFWVLEPGGLYTNTALVGFILTPVCSGLATGLVAIPFYMQGYKHEGYIKKTTDGKDVVDAQSVTTATAFA